MKAKPFRTEVKSIAIYLIISPGTNEVFIGKSQFPNTYQAYKNHVGRKIMPTKDLFQKAKEKENYPKMYLLDRLETTDVLAYGHVIAWTKYFLDAGFTVLAPAKNLEYAAELTGKNQKIFEKIKEKSIAEILSEDKILVENYTPKSKKRASVKDNPRQISFVVTPEEYEAIARRATNEHMSMSKYCKQIVLDGGVIRLDVSEYFNELRLVKDTLRNIQEIIFQTGKYSPADIVYIQKMVDKIIKGQRKLTDQMFKWVEKLRKDRTKIK